MIREIGGVTKEHIQNEARAIAKLCEGTHRNIVMVYGSGPVPRSSCYFIDMELCDVDLEAYLEWASSPPNAEQNFPWFTTEVASRAHAVETLSILADITNGLSFIHGEKEIHRDLKPHNGESVLVLDGKLI